MAEALGNAEEYILLVVRSKFQKELKNCKSVLKKNYEDYSKLPYLSPEGIHMWLLDTWPRHG
jgi:hypothetical protein